MSTPTPSQATSKKPGIPNSVSTPTALNLSSPAPRSVPSPATTRKDVSGKTPLGHNTTASSSGSKTVGGTPMMLNLSQQGSMASPMPGIPGMTPTGLGVDLGTPGHLNIATPSLGSSMMPTLSDLGLTASGDLKRNEDDERRAKMRKILKAIGRPKGRVSEEGILRVSRRLGLANDIDGETLRAEERERRVGNRTIGIAGNTLVVEVDLQKHMPTDVRVDFSAPMANSDGKSDKAGSVLLADLKTGGSAQINNMLDRFSKNLDLLARLDRLSTPKISCFGALSGLYMSLRRLYDQERKLAMQIHNDQDAQAEEHVVNRRSGRPDIHENGVIGVSLTYWNEQTSTDSEKMDIDEESKPHASAYKIWLETERCPSGLFPPIRITDSWLPESLELSADEHAIPWQDPPLTHIPADSDSMTDDTSQPLPDIRFVAKFDPPLILPWQVAANLFTSVQSSIPPAFQLPSYLALLLNLPPESSSTLLTTHAQVLRPSDEGMADARHTYNINIGRHDVGYRLEELPFSHPRQIIELLPILRQWLTVSNLLLRQLNAANLGSDTTVVRHDLLDSLLADSPSVRSDELPVECVLTLTPSPTLSLTFALPDGNLCNTDIKVLPNGELDIIGGESALAVKALNICNDIGVWIEWFRTKDQR